MNFVRKSGLALAAAVLATLTIGASTAAHATGDTGWGGYVSPENPGD